MNQTENVRKAASDLLAAQELVAEATARLNAEVGRFVQTPEGVRELAQFLAGSGRVVADGPNTDPPVPPVQAAPAPVQYQNVGAAIRAWFPPAPKSLTLSQVMDLLEQNGFSFSQYRTDPRQLVTSYFWQHRRTFKRVGLGTYQRVR